MNTTYTTLGEGRNTAVLFNTGNGTHRKVTTTGHDTARALAATLDWVYATISNALWDVAVAYDGKPAAARRRLLATFDAATRSAPATTDAAGVAADDDCWSLAEQLVTRLAGDVASQPAAVVAAVRRELADVCLLGYDDILVGGVMWAECYRPSYLRLVLNQTMADWTATAGDGSTRAMSPFFDGLDAAALALDQTTVEPVIGVPTGILIGEDTWSVLDMLREETSTHTADYGEGSARSLFSESGEESPCLTVVVSHLRAWMAANRPDLLEQYPSVGA